MRKRTLLTAMLTPIAAVAATVVMAGCGGKSSSAAQTGTTKSGTTSTPTTSTHKRPSKAPAY